MSADSVLSFYRTVNSSTGTVPGGSVYLQQSPDGHTGWSTVADIPTISAPGAFYSTYVRVNNPHAFWRLYAPASTSFPTPTYSNTIHTFRYQNRITGGPATTTVRPGTWVHFTGTLTQQGYGPWTPCAGQTVQLWFRPNGSTHSYLINTARTNATGAFALWARPTTTGTWTLIYQTASPWNTNASTSTTIHIN
jgi:hypothetical protein